MNPLGTVAIFIVTIQLVFATADLIPADTKKPESKVPISRPYKVLSTSNTGQKLSRRHSQDIFRRLRTLDFTESNQFCGETLFYAVEYYCIFIKGTSVYTPDYNFESTYVMGDDFGLENESRVRRNVKKSEKGL